MTIRVFTGPGQNGQRPAARILSVVEACPGNSLAPLGCVLDAMAINKQLQRLKGETEHGN